MLLLVSAALAGTLDLSYALEGARPDAPHQLSFFVDGVEVGRSPEGLESEREVIRVTVPDGAFELRIVDWAVYRGYWQERTVANGYDVDGVVTLRVEARPKHDLSLSLVPGKGAIVRGK